MEFAVAKKRRRSPFGSPIFSFWKITLFAPWVIGEEIPQTSSEKVSCASPTIAKVLAFVHLKRTFDWFWSCFLIKIAL